jgi:Putative peptidoglycan binding domain
MRRNRAHLLIAAATAALALAAGPARAAAQLDGNGMWIWYVSASGGSAEAIAKKANRRNIDVVMIKSADAGNYWGQFSPALVDALHDAGLNVCAWQFVYGSSPRAEARRGAEAARNGADCLLIDAEGHYEGRYRAADRYIDELRDRVGADYPLALASFPYVDYHPSFPYSVFLGKGAAQFNVPQMYWKAIGTSVREVYEHTYEVNAPYDRPIFPLGQTWQNPGRKAVIRFRRYARRHDAGGVSWWSWQETNGKEWRWVGKSLKRKRVHRARSASEQDYGRLARGDRGDLVLWAQQLLRAHGVSVGVDGELDAGTERAVRSFQSNEGLDSTGTVNDPTWRALLDRAPEPVDWSRREEPAAARSSAALRALRLELPSTPGRP